MMSSVQKSIYIREDDSDLWNRATAYAQRRRIPMSSLIMNALEEYLERRRIEGTEDP